MLHLPLSVSSVTFYVLIFRYFSYFSLLFDISTLYLLPLSPPPFPNLFAPATTAIYPRHRVESLEIPRQRESNTLVVPAPCAALHTARFTPSLATRWCIALNVDYSTDDTCATVHVRHTTADQSTRALPTRGHARPCVHCAGRQITNLCARRSLYYSTRARSLHVGTPPTCAPYLTVRLISSARAPVVILQFRNDHRLSQLLEKTLRNTRK